MVQHFTGPTTKQNLYVKMLLSSLKHSEQRRIHKWQFLWFYIFTINIQVRVEYANKYFQCQILCDNWDCRVWVWLRSSNIVQCASRIREYQSTRSLPKILPHCQNNLFIVLECGQTLFRPYGQPYPKVKWDVF